MVNGKDMYSKYRDALGHPVIKFFMFFFLAVQMGMLTLQGLTFFRAYYEVDFAATRWVLGTAILVELAAFFSTLVLVGIVYYHHKLVGEKGRDTYVLESAVTPMLNSWKWGLVGVVIFMTFLLFIVGAIYSIWQAVVCSQVVCGDLPYRFMWLIFGTLVIQFFANLGVVFVVLIEYYWIFKNTDKSHRLEESWGLRYHVWGKIFTTLSAVLSVLLFTAYAFIASIFYGWDNTPIDYTLMGVTVNISIAAACIIFVFFLFQVLTLVLAANHVNALVSHWGHGILVGGINFVALVAYLVMGIYHIAVVMVPCADDVTCTGINWQLVATFAFVPAIISLILYFFAGCLFHMEKRSDYKPLSRERVTD